MTMCEIAEFVGANIDVNKERRGLREEEQWES